MLNKRFKIAKCKTSLKLATSRIKLLKNKKAIQITQMKRELSQLLESQQDRTAIIRVEHVIREEKMIEAYDLIEIYCELIVTRLPIIESQKTCPIDLKEAITSVIFAAPRCSDIPELVDARRNFTAKYGKEFVSAALDLRPDSGVNRMMFEKLSVVAPDLQTKLKVLSSIAKEHNVNWEPSSFEETESKATNDLLNGPVNFEKASMMNFDSPQIQTSDVQNVQSNEEKMNVHDNLSEQNRRYTLGTQNVTSIKTNPSGTTCETMNRRHSFQTKTNNSSSGRENNWNMEFKDATSAAKAAAESAERASIAARAAAQLSRQYSNESHNSHIKDKTPQISTNSEFPQKDPRQHDTSPKATKKVIRKQPSVKSPRFNSPPMKEKKVSKRTDVDHEHVSKESIKTNSFDDETDSDDDYPKFDTAFEYDEEDAKTFFPSPGREESIRPKENTRVSSPKNNTRDKEEKQKVNSRKTRIELDDLVERDSTIVQESKNSEFLNQGDDLDMGKELKFATLIGGIRNKGGIKYTPYTKTGITDSSPSPKKSVDHTSKPSSFNSRARMEKKEPSDSMSSLESESESDDDNDKFYKNRSRFAPPEVFLNDRRISDSDEEVVLVTKPTPTGLSRRTKGHVEPEGKTVISRSSMHSSTNESSPTKKVSEQASNPGKKIVESGKTESQKTSQTSVENKVKKPSHVHPKLPDYDLLAARIQSLQTNRQ